MTGGSESLEGALSESLVQAWGFTSAPRVTLLHKGENTHYLCRASGTDYFVRLSRPECDAAALESELAWIEALSPVGAAPQIIRTTDGRSCGTLLTDGPPRFITLFELLHGYHLSAPEPEDWHRYGQVMRRFHETARSVVEASSENWAGRQRPVFSAAREVESAAETLTSTPWVPADLATGFTAVAGDLLEAIKRSSLVSDTDSFIHFDLHLANLLVIGDAWVPLDFEESCFGPRALDLGVVRLHARAEGRLDEAWGPFAEGYGDGVVVDEAHLGAALKAFYLAGKIPHRLDVPDVAENPEGILRGLLNSIRKEIT